MPVFNAWRPAIDAAIWQVRHQLRNLSFKALKAQANLLILFKN